MLKRLKLSVIAIAAVLNAAVITAMAVTAYAGMLNPAVHPTLAALTLAFPVLLLLDVGCLVLWAFVGWRWTLLPLSGLLVCAGAVRAYLPVNVGGGKPDGAFKVVSYNVEGLACDSAQADRLIDWLADSDAAIICLQEAGEGAVNNRLTDTLTALGYHNRKLYSREEHLAVFSRWPVTDARLISYASRGNASAVFWLSIDGERVAVVNNHLETNRLSPDDKAQFKDLVKGDLPPSASVRGESRFLLGKLGTAAALRAPQAEAVHACIDSLRRQGAGIIVAGDFNDNPLSYTRRTIADGLTDCYIATANGPGWSYARNGMFVRIDNLFCSDEWQPYGAQVDTKIDASDHYPIYCWLKKRPKH